MVPIYSATTLQLHTSCLTPRPASPRSNPTSSWRLWIGALCLALTVGAARSAEANEEAAALAAAAESRRVQELVDAMRLELAVSHAVSVELVAANPLRASVEPVKGNAGTFLLSIEQSFLEQLTPVELRAVIAHELGHVWIYTHHPYLQTEQLANQIALRVVSRESLDSVVPGRCGRMPPRRDPCRGSRRRGRRSLGASDPRRLEIEHAEAGPAGARFAQPRSSWPCALDFSESQPNILRALVPSRCAVDRTEMRIRLLPMLLASADSPGQRQLSWCPPAYPQSPGDAHRADHPLGRGRLSRHVHRGRGHSRRVRSRRPEPTIDYFSEYLESEVLPPATAEAALHDYIARKFAGLSHRRGDRYHDRCPALRTRASDVTVPRHTNRIRRLAVRPTKSPGARSRASRVWSATSSSPRPWNWR